MVKPWGDIDGVMPWGDIDPAQVHQLRDEGLTQKQIAEELGCGQSTVSDVLNNIGSYYHGNMNRYNTSDSPPERGTASEYLAVYTKPINNPQNFRCGGALMLPPDEYT